MGFYRNTLPWYSKLLDIVNKRGLTGSFTISSLGCTTYFRWNPRELNQIVEQMCCKYMWKAISPKKCDEVINMNHKILWIIEYKPFKFDFFCTYYDFVWYQTKHMWCCLPYFYIICSSTTSLLWIGSFLYNRC